jgi:hypothetical protein
MPEGSQLEQLCREYASGKLDAIKDDLASFLRRQAAAIRCLRNEYFGAQDVPPTADEVAIKMFILKSRSINPSREILDQLDEINREKWIRGINAGISPDPQSVAMDWARLHSPGWRDHRVMAIIYVFEREKDRYLALIREAARGAPPPGPAANGGDEGGPL